MPRRPAEGIVSRLERRTVGRSGISVSVLGVPVERLLSSSPTSDDDPSAAAAINLLRNSGVTYFDAGPPSSASERFLGDALGPDGAVTVECGVTLSGESEFGSAPSPAFAPPALAAGHRQPSAFGPRPDGWAEELNDALHRARDRLRRPRIEIAWIDLTDAHILAEPAVIAAIKEAQRDHRVGAWGIRSVDSTPESSLVATAVTAGVDALAMPLHLLNAPEVAGLAAAVHLAGASVIGVDPHATGRLDGQLLRDGALLARPGPPRPVIWSELRRELEPVARLGLLTSGRRRTLGQAALQYVLGTPGVASVLPDWRDPARFAEWLEAMTREPLTDIERRAVEHPPMGSATDESAGASGGRDAAGR